MNLLSRVLGFRPSYRTAVEFLYIAIHVIQEYIRIVTYELEDTILGDPIWRDTCSSAKPHVLLRAMLARRSSCSHSVYFSSAICGHHIFFHSHFPLPHSFSVYAELMRGVGDKMSTHRLDYLEFEWRILAHTMGGFEGVFGQTPPYSVGTKKFLYIFTLLANKAEHLHCVTENHNTVGTVDCRLFRIYEHYICYRQNPRRPNKQTPLWKILSTPLES